MDRDAYSSLPLSGICELPDLNFKGKQNPFSESFRSNLQRVADGVADYLENRAGYLMASRKPEPRIPRGFVATILESRLINGLDAGPFSGGNVNDEVKNVWMYQWVDQQTQGQSSSSRGYSFFALNGAEFGNTGSGSESYGVGVSSGSPAIELLPIGNYGAVSPSVFMHLLPAPVSITLPLYQPGGAAAGTVTVSTPYIFFAGNEVEVTC